MGVLPSNNGLSRKEILGSQEVKRLTKYLNGLIALLIHERLSTILFSHITTTSVEVRASSEWKSYEYYQGVVTPNELQHLILVGLCFIPFLSLF